MKARITLPFIVLLWIGLLSGLSSFATQTVIRYKILKDGDEIGEIIATRSQQGAQTIYDVATKMSIRVILKQDIGSEIHSTYLNGVLQSSTAKTMINEGLHHKCVTTRKGSGYDVLRDKKLQRINGSIYYSGILLYFREPQDGSQVYSELNGNNGLASKISNQHYKLTDAKSGRENLYWYKAGILQRAELHHALMDIEIERIN